MSFVCIENRTVERTHPCGAPVFITISSDSTGSLHSISFNRLTVYMLRVMHHDCICTCYSVVDLFNRIPSQLLWQVSSHDAIAARNIFVGQYKYPPMSTYRNSFIQLNAMEYRVENLPKVFTQQHMIRTRILIVESRQL